MSTTTTDPCQTTDPTEVVIATEKRLLVQCPYNINFIFFAKRLAGRWLPDERLWEFSTKNEDLVRGLCRQWFGTDGTFPPDLVDVQITYLQERSEAEGSVTAFGRVVARARGRSQAARLGEGVELVEGKAFGSGEQAGWRTVIDEGTVLRMQGVPRSLATSITPVGTAVELIETITTSLAIPELQAERIRLGARIAEIDATLLGKTSADPN